MLRLDNFKLFYTIENNCELVKIKEKHSNEGKNFNRGLTGIEPATSSTQRKNHTARPKTHVIVLFRRISFLCC